jgi:hypothetical protein
MPEFTSLEDYAAHIRRTTGRLSSQLFRELGTSPPAALAVAALHEEAADIVTGRQMEAERAEGDDLDLSKLPPVFARDEAASPFDEE